MLSVLVVCLIGTVYLWWLQQKRRRRLKAMDLPPIYSGALPFIGNTHMLFGNTTRLWMQIKWATNETLKHGGVSCALIGGDLYYVIADPEDNALVANTCLQKHFAYEFGKPWLGEGLVTSSGPVWKHHRKLLNPAFSLQVLHSYLAVFNKQSRKLVTNLVAEVGKGPFDHLAHIKKISLETICLTAFGLTTKDDQEFNKAYMSAVDQILNIITLRFQNFWLQSQLIYSWSKLKQREDQLIKVLNNMSHDLILRKKAALKDKCIQNETETKTSGIKCKAFMDLMIELSEENVLTDREIREEVDTIVVAAYDTTSCLLTYILMLLGTYPDTQERLFEELQNVFGDSDRDVEKEDLIKLVYTEAVIKETLRLYPIVPVGLRYVDRDVKLKNYTMRAGSQYVLLMYGVHRHPVWGPDAEQFKPERWLQPETLPDNANAFVGFSLGKRSCMGKTFAIISVKTTLAHVLRRYRVTADISKLVLKLDFMLKPVSGHQVILEERT